MVDAKEMKKILRANGYDYIRCMGSHFIYSNGKNTICKIGGKDHGLDGF